MKVTKIPGMGRFGVYIDDVDFKTLTDEEWQEIGKLHLKTLVTIIRDTKLEPMDYFSWMRKWGTGRSLQEYRLVKKYNTYVSKLLVDARDPNSNIDPEDRFYLNTVDNMLVYNGDQLTSLMKVTGKKNEEGRPLGMFAEGELLWHSNESGNLCFAPGVSFYGYDGVVGSATGFVTTVDWYEEQSESFRSELDEMVLIHRFTPGKINPGLRSQQDNVMYENMCPEEIELPLVMKSPGGYRGMHYSVHTISQVKGMTMEESQKLFQRIDSELLTDKYVYDHWYQNNGDLCLFDNSITLHRRLGGITNRMGYRFQYDYETLVDEPYNPYYQEPWSTKFVEQMTDLKESLGLTRLPLPNHK